MAGPLKTLYTMLASDSFVTAAGITLAFGEEAIEAQEAALPYVVMVPRRGAIGEGYAMDGSTAPASIPPPAYIDQNTECLWEVAAAVEFYVWADAPPNSTAPAVDAADAIETVRLALLSAFRNQRAQPDAAGSGNAYYGLSWKPLGEEWETAQNAVSRRGRALKLAVQFDLPAVMGISPSGEVVVQTTQFNPTFNDSPG